MFTRRCDICKEWMNFKEEFDKIICYKKRIDSSKWFWVHFDCLVDEKLNKKNNKLSKEDIIKEVKEIQNKKENVDHIKEALQKDEFWDWIYRSYGVVSLPDWFFRKIDNVINGVYKEMTLCIPLEDLLDMWKRKKQELDKIYVRNVSRGNNMDVTGRLNYDLAIVISKYDSYLKWKENNKLIELNEKETKELMENKIDLIKINKNNNQKVSSNNELDISNYIDEI